MLKYKQNKTKFCERSKENAQTFQATWIEENMKIGRIRTPADNRSNS